MPKETKAQRTTRVAMLLADYANRAQELNKLKTIVDGLKAQVAEVEPGIYGEWQRANGTPRALLDQQAVKADYAERGVPLPTKMSAAPIIVTPVAGK